MHIITIIENIKTIKIIAYANCWTSGGVAVMVLVVVTITVKQIENYMKH
jgi:hypothetical protein